MEDEYFDWEDWDLIDNAHIVFLVCKLKKDFGPLKKDSCYQSIDINFHTGKVSAYQEHDYPVAEFEVKLAAV